jgi:CHC2 zinc finger/RepB DNA-primase from phage plasmid
MTAPPATPHRSDRAARSELQAFLRALADGALIGSFFELRERHGQLMRRRFYPTEFPDRAVSAILRAGRNRDIYIGAAPRARTHGGRAAIAWLTTLWIDADTPEAIERLDAFTPAPSILVATGRGRHAYWLLKRPVDVDTGEHANLRLAQHLAADPSCFDAARILRPPHSTNFQHQPPRPVRLLRLGASERHVLASVTAGLPAPAENASPPAPRAPRDGRAARSAVGDPLLELEPAFYVSALLGVPIGRDRKVSCPFHADEHPSLHIYPTARQGWHCFSCRRGGTVYDLAGELIGMQTRGVEFLQLRALLRERLLGRGA